MTQVKGGLKEAQLLLRLESRVAVPFGKGDDGEFVNA